MTFEAPAGRAQGHRSRFRTRLCQEFPEISPAARTPKTKAKVCYHAKEIVDDGPGIYFPDLFAARDGCIGCPGNFPHFRSSYKSQIFFKIPLRLQIEGTAVIISGRIFLTSFFLKNIEI